VTTASTPPSVTPTPRPATPPPSPSHPYRGALRVSTETPVSSEVEASGFSPQQVLDASKSWSGSISVVYHEKNHSLAIADTHGHEIIFNEEAHSGLGANTDNPQSASIHNGGAIPPGNYELKLDPKKLHTFKDDQGNYIRDSKGNLVTRHAIEILPLDKSAAFDRNQFLLKEQVYQNQSHGCITLQNDGEYKKAEAIVAGIQERQGGKPVRMEVVVDEKVPFKPTPTKNHSLSNSG
jgi:hypothetical protein